MKTRIILIAIMALAALGASAQTAQRYTLKVNDFTELKVIDGINVDYRCNPDSAGLAVFTALPQHASLVMFNPKKSKLEVMLSDGAAGRDSIPTVTVYSSFLNKAENSGDSLVRVFSPVCGPKFQAKVIGNGSLSAHNVNAAEISANVLTGRGQITLDGRCDKASYSTTGTGTINADKVKAADVSVKITGTGSVGCSVTGKLSIFGLGSGKVYYRGNPRQISSKGVGITAINLDE